MSGIGSRRVWREDDRHRSARITDTEFWLYVDSQRIARPHPGECDSHPSIPGARLWRGWDDRERFCTVWSHLRGDSTYCLASKSDLYQCAQPTVLGVPFCAFHFDSVWTYFLAQVEADRGRVAIRKAEIDVELTLRNLQIDAAMVRDARAALERQAERVYFFLAGHAVKIGRSVHPERRVRTLQGTKSPDDVDVSSGDLVGTIPGGAHTESALHRRFALHRLVGEWFTYAPIAAEIADLLGDAEADAVA